MQTILRVGVGESVVDNYCSGGCIYPIDIQSGRVDNTGWGHGADYSGIKIVGWDIVVADNPCHVDFIEGNHDSHSGMLGMDNKVTYRELKSLIYDK